MNAQPPTAASQPGTPLEDRFRRSLFWAIELELSTRSEGKGTDGIPSGAEVILRALIAYQQSLFNELEQMRDSCINGKEGRAGSDPLAYVRDGTLVCTMEQIKTCNAYISLLTKSLAADLREVGNAIRLDTYHHEQTN